MPLPGSGPQTPTQSQGPTLLPNFDPVVSSNGSLSYQSPSAYDTANPRTNATATITVSDSSITNGDTLFTTITCNVFKPVNGNSNAVQVSAPVVTGDTLSTLAEKLAKAINDNAIFRQFGIFADAANAVVTISWPGPIGNFATVTTSVNGGATEALAPASQSMTGGAGYVIPYANFSFMLGSSLVQFQIGKPVKIDYANLSNMVAQSARIQ